jgi:hypothetical protein
MMTKFFVDSIPDMKKYLLQQLVVCCSERQRLSGDLTATSVQIALNDGKIEALRAALLNTGVPVGDIDDVDNFFGEIEFKKSTPSSVSKSDLDDYDMGDIEFLSDKFHNSMSFDDQDERDSEFYGPEYLENGRTWV